MVDNHHGLRTREDNPGDSEYNEMAVGGKTEDSSLAIAWRYQNLKVQVRHVRPYDKIFLIRYSNLKVEVRLVAP